MSIYEFKCRSCKDVFGSSDRRVPSQCSGCGSSDTYRHYSFLGLVGKNAKEPSGNTPSGPKPCIEFGPGRYLVDWCRFNGPRPSICTTGSQITLANNLFAGSDRALEFNNSTVDGDNNFIV